MLEIIVVGLYMKYWFLDLFVWISGIVVMVIFGVVNLIFVKLFGEFEFWFVMIKIVIIILMIIVGFGIIFFGFGNGGDVIGLLNLWFYGGFFVGGFFGFFFVLFFVIVVY